MVSPLTTAFHRVNPTILRGIVGEKGVMTRKKRIKMIEPLQKVGNED
jgi:hypothetical protein